MNWLLTCLVLTGSIVLQAEADNCGDCVCSPPPDKNTRIKGGVEAPDQKPNWVANIQSKTDKGTSWCGGTVINEKFIVTAAHCIAAKAEDTTVTLGSVDVNNKDKAIRRTAKALIVHKDYNMKLAINDIALIKIDPINLSEAGGRVSSVCLSTECRDHSGEDGLIFGWGKQASNGQVTPKLRMLHFKIPTAKSCKDKFGKYFNADKQQCCGTPNGAKGTCGGDSGGPMVVQHKTLKFYQQIGLDSFGGKTCNTYSVFTKVCYYINWIKEHTKDACKCKEPTS